MENKKQKIKIILPRGILVVVIRKKHREERRTRLKPYYSTLMRSVYEKYSPDKKGEEEIPPGSYSVEQVLGEKNYPESEKNARHGGRAVLHSSPSENGA